MNRSRKTVLWLSALSALFVLGVAIWTGNPGLFILAPLAAISGYVASRQK